MLQSTIRESFCVFENHIRTEWMRVAELIKGRDERLFALARGPLCLAAFKFGRRNSGACRGARWIAMLERARVSGARKTIVVVVLAAIGLSLFYFTYQPLLSSCPSASTNGYALYVRVVSDNPGGSPINGAMVGGSQIRTCVVAGETKTATSALSPQATSTSGTIVIMPVSAGNYSIVVQYNGREYTFDAYVRPVDTTNLTLSVPSGLWNETYVNE
jgi:hypothetical protein